MNPALPKAPDGAWCKVVTLTKIRQTETETEADNSVKAQTKVAVRASITFRSDLYKTFEIAQQKMVSMAWVVRDSAESYIADQTGKVTLRAT